MNIDAMLAGFGSSFSLWMSVLLVGSALRLAVRLVRG